MTDGSRLTSDERRSDGTPKAGKDSTRLGPSLVILSAAKDLGGGADNRRRSSAPPALLLAVLLLSAVLPAFPAVPAFPAATAPPALRPVPAPDTARMEPAVRAQLDAAARKLAGAASQPPAEAAEIYGEAGGLYLLYGLLDAALPALADAESLAPRDPRWPYYLGVACEQRADLDAARAAFLLALALAPKDVPTLLRLGEVELLADRLDAAAERFAAALAVDPGSGPSFGTGSAANPISGPSSGTGSGSGAAAAHAGLGRVALARRQGAEAARELAAALAAEPQATSLHAQLAAAYRLAGQPDRARAEAALYGEGKVAFPDPWMDRLGAGNAGARGHATRGTRALEAGQIAVALAELGAAVAADPADADAWANLGIARERQGDLRGAEEAYRKAIALAPEAPRPRYNLGTLLAQRGEAREAIEQLAAAVRLAPDFKDARINLATAEADRGDAQAALTQYDEILRRDPGDAAVRYRRALALLDLGRPGDSEAAAAELAKLVEADPAAVEPRAALATALLRAGRDREARAELDKGLELTRSPDLAAALVRVLACSEDAALRDGHRALSLAESLLAAGETPEREALAAMALAELGRYPEAAARERKAIDAAAGAPPAVRERLRAQLALYEAGRPCRSPWRR